MNNLFIKPKYYEKFECLKDKCSNSCCINWNVSIDSKTLKKYNKIENKDFCKYVLNNIDSKTKKVILNKKICPFLDDDSLCKIQKNCGEDLLCNTCKTFPRYSQKYKNITRHDLYLSCPHSFNLIYKFHNQNKYLKFLASLPLDKDFINYINFQIKIDKAYKYNISKKIQSFFNYLKNSINKIATKKSFNEIALFYKELQLTFNKLDFSNQAMLRLKNKQTFINFEHLSKTQQQTLQKIFNKFSNKYKKQLNTIFNYYMNYYSFKSPTNSNKLENLYKVVSLFYMCKLTLFLSYITQREALNIPFLISNFSRAIEHSNSLKLITSKIKDLF